MNNTLFSTNCLHIVWMKVEIILNGFKDSDVVEVLLYRRKKYSLSFARRYQLLDMTESDCLSMASIVLSKLIAVVFVCLEILSRKCEEPFFRLQNFVE